MYQKVYAIMYNSTLSSQAFNSIEGAFSYCEERAERVGNMGWVFVDAKGNIYRIFELKIK